MTGSQVLASTLLHELAHAMQFAAQELFAELNADSSPPPELRDLTPQRRLGLMAVTTRLGMMRRDDLSKDHWFSEPYFEHENEQEVGCAAETNIFEPGAGAAPSCLPGPDPANPGASPFGALGNVAAGSRSPFAGERGTGLPTPTTPALFSPLVGTVSAPRMPPFGGPYSILTTTSADLPASGAGTMQNVLGQEVWTRERTSSFTFTAAGQIARSAVQAAMEEHEVRAFLADHALSNNSNAIPHGLPERYISGPDAAPVVCWFRPVSAVPEPAVPAPVVPDEREIARVGDLPLSPHKGIFVGLYLDYGDDARRPCPGISDRRCAADLLKSFGPVCFPAAPTDGPVSIYRVLVEMKPRADKATCHLLCGPKQDGAYLGLPFGPFRATKARLNDVFFLPVFRDDAKALKVSAEARENDSWNRISAALLSIETALGCIPEAASRIQDTA
ncbi:hypothetical protein P8C59_005516 [Phyllachora maydis]|uniref:Uncharacterized protein n=1 Tax=Phyllachora maydis TaxID=1825666 RepID=A0AAD9I4M8_9PEZI|nr:hypothetical protein P8C59_005516 [Phyllachora maydis]